MIVTHLQQLFADNALREAVVEPSSDGNGWLVEFADQSGDRLVLTDSSGDAVLFMSLDEATDAAHDVGFARIRVEERF